MSTVSLTLDEIFDLAKKTLLANGCDEENASILADTIMRAERDGSVSHGLFRLPAYVAGLKSKKINGKARPELENVAPSIIKVLGNNAVAPMVLSLGLPAVIELAKKNGVAVLAIKNSHHMAALWPETEAIAEAGLLLVSLVRLISLLLHQLVLRNPYMVQTQFLLLGLDQVKLQLSMIWPQPQWQWVKFRLQKEKDTKFPLEQA